MTEFIGGAMIVLGIGTAVVIEELIRRNNRLIEQQRQIDND